MAKQLNFDAKDFCLKLLRAETEVVGKIRELVQFDELIQVAHKRAKEKGLKPADISVAVAKARGHK